MITADFIAKGLVEGPGFVSLQSADCRTLVGEPTLTDWETFASSWNHLEVDEYMADGGRFRRRRFGRFVGARGGLTREPHGPHYQSREYNALNGGIERWFEPVTDTIASHPITRRLMDLCLEVFGRAEAADSKSTAWKIEMHQFRIEPTAREAGKPTPEGAHRDGVDWVFVGLIARTGVAGGVTGIADASGQSLGSFTLSAPLDAVFLNDHRLRHGVTPIEVLTAGAPAYRDVLVLTFRKFEARTP